MEDGNGEDGKNGDSGNGVKWQHQVATKESINVVP